MCSSIFSASVFRNIRRTKKTCCKDCSLCSKILMYSKFNHISSSRRQSTRTGITGMKTRKACKLKAIRHNFPLNYHSLKGSGTCEQFLRKGSSPEKNHTYTVSALVATPFTGGGKCMLNRVCFVQSISPINRSDSERRERYH